MRQEYTIQQKVHIACFVILWIALLFFAVVMVFTMPTSALDINPSIHEKDPWWCENSLTGFVCADKGEQGSQGPPGPMNMTPNMTAGPQGPAGVGGGQVLYFHHETSPDLTGYEGLEIIPAGNAEVNEAITVTAAEGLKVVDPYITLTGYPGQTTWQAGLWRFRTFHYVDNPEGTTTFVFTVYNRTAAGNMTKLFEVVSEDINAATATEYLTPYVQQIDYRTNSSDRMVINVSVNTSSVASKTAHFVYEGAIHTSHVQTPLPLSVSAFINESYAYLPGRAGGQTLNGGTASTDDLILNASTNGAGAASSTIILQPVNGNVGIGGVPITTSKLHVSTPSGLQNVYFSSGSGTANNLVFRNGTSNMFLFGTNPADFRIYAYGLASEALAIKFNTGYIGMGTTTPTSPLHVTGAVRFSNYGAGTATFDAGGNITSVSDAKAKTNIAPYPAGLAQVLQLAPKQYKYSPDSGLDTKNTYVGFIAQDVEKVLPDAVKTKDDVKYEQKLSKKGATADEDEYTTVEVKTGTTTKSLDDRAIIAALVNAVKEQQTEINALKARIEKLETSK